MHATMFQVDFFLQIQRVQRSALEQPLGEHIYFMSKCGEIGQATLHTVEASRVTSKFFSECRLALCALCRIQNNKMSMPWLGRDQAVHSKVPNLG